MMKVRTARRLRLTLAIPALALVSVLLSACEPPPGYGPCDRTVVRWASSTNILYVTGYVSCTLTELDALTSAPLAPVAGTPGAWHLGANVRLEQGARLQLDGRSIGGDVDQLRLRSNNTGGATDTISLRAQWGTIAMGSTQVTSWDDAVAGPDTNSANGRSFIHVRSFLESDGATARESRMDIVNSDVGYLGHYAAEAYGLTWKVSGSSPGLYAKVDVLGTVRNSRIHHNHFGLYTYGAFGMTIADNEVDRNVAYGIDPHDDSDQLDIERNHVHHNGNHGIICSQRCDGLLIKGNRSENNTGNGIMLHRQVTDSVVEDNVVASNTDAGIAIFDSAGNRIRNNESSGNLRGVRLSVGASDNVFIGNRITGNTSYGLYFYKGTDVPTGGGDGQPHGNRFSGTTISGSGEYAIQASDTRDNEFLGTVSSGNAGGLRFVRSTGNRVDGSSLAATPVEVLGGSARGSLTLIGFGAVRVTIDSTASVRLADGGEAVFDPEQVLATTVTPTLSELVLDQANIGSASTVVTRKLFVTPNSGSATVDPTTWETSGARRKEWITRASSASVALAHRVGDLAPSTAYRVLRNGVLLTTATTSAAGELTFTHTPGTTASVRYTVQP